MTEPRQLFQINRQSKLPLYDLIEQNFRDLILRGVLQPGEPLPSEWELSDLYGVSRLTLRHALDNLAQQGWLVRKHGIGTFVSRPSPARITANQLSFSEQIRAIGRAPSSRAISSRIVPADAEVAARLGLAEGEPVVELVRVRLADATPMLLETSYLAACRVPGLEQVDLSDDSLYEILNTRYQMTVTTLDQTMVPVLLSESEAGYLEFPPGSPALFSEIVAYSAEGSPVEYCRSLTRGDQCKFYFHFRRNES